jgi:hypothetical protein
LAGLVTFQNRAKGDPSNAGQPALAAPVNGGQWLGGDGFLFHAKKSGMAVNRTGLILSYMSTPDIHAIRTGTRFCNAVGRATARKSYGW